MSIPRITLNVFLVANSLFGVVGIAAGKIWIPDTGSVEVRNTAAAPLEAEPGDVVTAIFSVKNTTSEERTFQAHVDLPAGWTLVSSLEPFSAGARQTVRRLISFRVPRSAAVGTFSVGYTVIDVHETGGFDSGSVEVTVGENRRFDVEKLEAPKWVASGKDFRVSMALSNVGNASLNVRLVTSTTPETPFRLSLPDEVAFAPGERRTLVVELTAVEAIQRKQRQWFRLQVWTEGTMLAESAVAIDVLPVARSVKNPGTFPVSLKLHAFSSYRGRGGQIEISGRGSLREDRDDIVQVGIRTPDLSSSSLFARRDEYRFSYVTESWAILLGDHPYSLSPLTEFGRNGRGAGVIRAIGPMTTTAFYSRNRYSLPREDAFGLNMTYSLTQAIRFGANFLDKNGTQPGESITVSSEFQPLDDVRVDFEFGEGGNGGTRSTAFAAGLHGHREFGSVDSRFMKLGPTFPGNNQDRTYASMNAIALPAPGLAIAGSFLRDERRLLGLSATGSRIESRFVRGGPSYLFGFLGGQVGIGATYKYQAQNAVFEEQGEFRNHRSAELEVKFDIGGAAFGVATEFGSVFASFSPSRLATARYELSSSGDFGRISYNLGAEVERGATMYRLTSRRSALISAGVEAQIGNRFRVGVDAIMMTDNSFSIRRYTSLATDITYLLPAGHKLLVRTNFSGIGPSQFGHDIGVTYEVPVNIPKVGKRGPRVRGRVVDALTGAGVDGVMLRVGKKTTRTSRDGRFALNVTGNGEEYLFVDAASIGLDRVTLVEMPLEIDARQLGSEIEIAIASAAAINGIVNRLVHSDGALQSGQLTVSGVESGVVLELSDGIGRYRVTTGDDGRFSIKHLRPGTWTVRIAYANLPDNYIIGEPVTVRLAPGETATVALNTRPRRREIRFVAKGRLGGRRVVVRDSIVAERPQPADADSVGRNLEKKQVGAFGYDTLSACSAPPQLPVSHVVTSGETLTSIASTYYCNVMRWPVLWFDNQALIGSPHHIRPGEVIHVPRSVGELGIEPTEVLDADRDHVVRANETLPGIAETYYGDAKFWPRIWMANRLIIGDATTIEAGAILIIPGSRLHRFERSILSQ